MGSFPDLHICTYDVKGKYLDSGRAKPARHSGLVEHTQQLLAALARRHPGIRIALTHTGAAEPAPPRPLLTPEGQTVSVRALATRFPQHLSGPHGGSKNARLVRRFYETRIADPDNPVWRSLAAQYADAIRQAGIAHLLLQHVNPLVSVLKAEEWGLLDTQRRPGLTITAVLHDGADAQQRLGYAARRLERTRARVRLIAVSHAVRAAAIDAGVPGDMVRVIHNGLDVQGFQRRLDQARAEDAFGAVRKRNGLPPGCCLILLSARRTAWKGHVEAVRAARLLADRGWLEQTRVVFNGAGMHPDSAAYERDLRNLINTLGLSGEVVLLDELTPLEVAACYAEAHIAVAPSRNPEPFGYAVIEAMLAGVPVVATDHGGPAEYITSGASGVLTPPRDPAALAVALETLLADEPARRRIGRAGRQKAEGFSLDHMWRSYEAVITDTPVSPQQSQAATGGAAR